MSLTTTSGGNGSFSPEDLRFYISDVKLIDANDQDVSVTLPTDNQWQAEQIALLDFEDKTGNCTSGTTETNQTLKISAPAGTYKGIAFTLGLPVAVNQTERTAATTPSPLNIAAMYWSWTAGYKFMKFEFNTGSGKTNLHIGSTGCSAYVAGGTPVQCTNPFRSQIRLTSNQNFDPSRDKIRLNLGNLFNGFPNNAAALTCMPAQGGANCNTLLGNVGLSTDGAGTSTGNGTAFQIVKQ